MPNPSTVYIDEFDECIGNITNVSGSLPKPQIETIEIASKEWHSELDAIANGDFMDHALQNNDLRKIFELEKDCFTRENILRTHKLEVKDAQADLDAAISELRGYIRGLKIEMPLFGSRKSSSPAGETGGDDKRACDSEPEEEAGVGSGDEEVDQRYKRAGEEEVQGVGGSDDRVDPKGYAEAGQDCREGERVFQSPHRRGNGDGDPEETNALSLDDLDKKWNSTRLSDLVAPAILKKLAAKHLKTIKDLDTFFKTHTCDDVKLTQKQAEQLDRVLDEYCESLFGSDESDGTPVGATGS